MTDKKNPLAPEGQEKKEEVRNNENTTIGNGGQGGKENLKEIIARAREKHTVKDIEMARYEREMARLTGQSPVMAEVIKSFDHNIEEAAKKPEQLPLGLLPTDFCRTTFCRPIRRRDMRVADIITVEKFESNWGVINYIGPDCGMDEEDLLITIIGRWIKNGMKEFECQYADLLDNLGYKRGSNGKHQRSSYKKLKDSLVRLNRSSFECIFYKKNGRTAGIATHVISYQWDDERKCLKINVDNWFVGTIGRGFVTGIDLKERKALKGDTAKALHRFLSSHSGSEGHINVFVLAQVIGMNMKQPRRKIRQLLKLAIRELKRIGFLQKKSCIKDDVLHWHRGHKVLGGPKLKAVIQAPED